MPRCHYPVFRYGANLRTRSVLADIDRPGRKCSNGCFNFLKLRVLLPAFSGRIFWGHVLRSPIQQHIGDLIAIGANHHHVRSSSKNGVG